MRRRTPAASGRGNASPLPHGASGRGRSTPTPMPVPRWPDRRNTLRFARRPRLRSRRTRMVAGRAIEFIFDTTKKQPVPVVATMPNAASARDQCCARARPFGVAAGLGRHLGEGLRRSNGSRRPLDPSRSRTYPPGAKSAAQRWGSLAPGSVRCEDARCQPEPGEGRTPYPPQPCARRERAIDQSKESPYRIGQAVASVPASEGDVS